MVSDHCLGLSFTPVGLGFALAGLGSTLAGLGFTLAGLGFTLARLGFALAGLGFTLAGLGSTLAGLGFTLAGLPYETLVRKPWSPVLQGAGLHSCRAALRDFGAKTAEPSLTSAKNVVKHEEISRMGPKGVRGTF